MRLGSPLFSAIPGLRHAFFTRDGGVSDGIYQSLNGGLGSNDDPANVAGKSPPMAEQMGVARSVLSVWQIHSPDAVVASGPWQATLAARRRARHPHGRHRHRRHRRRLRTDPVCRAARA